MVAFIDLQRKAIVEFQNEKKVIEEELHEKQRELDHLRNHYLSPYLEQIQQINYEIGKVNSSLDQLEKIHM